MVVTKLQNKKYEKDEQVQQGTAQHLQAARGWELYVCDVDDGPGARLFSRVAVLDAVQQQQPSPLLFGGANAGFGWRKILVAFAHDLQHTAVAAALAQKRRPRGWQTAVEDT